ncbi:MAG: hypothetical protein NZZ60_00140 [Bacteroidia bacterium]|nr:hypothetical protein [Bacteroidia bacterium]MCX7651782.1 hypothetical protein [Bacteroidia bacterium]MDW8416346.1 hypothetical protein [Bacteroidia bacterium]
MSQVGLPIHLPTLYARTRWFYPLLFDEIIIRSNPPLRQILQKYPKVVHAISHAGTLGWIPAILALLRGALLEGGKHRTALGIFHRGLYRFGASRWVLRAFFQSTEPPTFAKVIQAFRDGPINDIALFPEGDNCVLGDVYDIRPFRSPKFVELALAVNAPILITVHRGAEEWGKDFYIPSWMLRWVKLIEPAYVRPLMKNPVLNLPIRMTRIPKFSLNSALYFPKLSYDQLSMRPRERWFQLHEEAEKIKAIMKALLKEMPYV